jgi:hypothetical protein
MVEPQNHGRRFFGLGLKTSSSGLVIYASKSSRRFLDLGIKTKRTSVCRLRHKTDRGMLAWDTRRDLATCFSWKQVRLEFLSLASRLMETQRWVVHMASSWRLHRDEAEDGRVNVMRCIGLFYHKIIVFYVLGSRGNLIFSLLLGHINRTLEGWSSLPLLHFSICISKIQESEPRTNFHFNNQGRESDDLCVGILMKKIVILHIVCSLFFSPRSESQLVLLIFLLTFPVAGPF